MSVSYEIVTRDRTGREHVRPYHSEDALAPGSVVLLRGRYWLMERVERSRGHAQPARYRLTLRHPDGRREPGAFRRFRADAPTVGHQLTTLEDGAPISWTVSEQRLARDDAGEPFLESIAERDYAGSESLPDHQLEHALEQDDDTSVADTVLARATEPGLAIELVGLEGGQAPEWESATRYLDSLILEELEDDLLEQCSTAQPLRADVESRLTNGNPRTPPTHRRGAGGGEVDWPVAGAARGAVRESERQQRVGFGKSIKPRSCTSGPARKGENSTQGGAG